MANCPLSGKPCDAAKTFNVMNVVDGLATEHFLCSTCVASHLHGVSPPEDQVTVVEAAPGEAAGVLKGMRNKIQSLVGPRKRVDIVPVSRGCPACRTTLQSVAENKRLGCTKCFAHFGLDLVPILKAMANAHEVEPVMRSMFKNQTKEPSPLTFVEEKKHLEQEIKFKLDAQEYEAAAELHEKLKVVLRFELEINALQAKLDEAVAAGNFDRAETIRAAREALLRRSR